MGTVQNIIDQFTGGITDFNEMTRSFRLTVNNDLSDKFSLESITFDSGMAFKHPQVSRLDSHSSSSWQRFQQASSQESQDGSTTKAQMHKPLVLNSQTLTSEPQNERHDGVMEQTSTKP